MVERRILRPVPVRARTAFGRFPDWVPEGSSTDAPTPSSADAGPCERVSCFGPLGRDPDAVEDLHPLPRRSAVTRRGIAPNTPNCPTSDNGYLLGTGEGPRPQRSLLRSPN